MLKDGRDSKLIQLRIRTRQIVWLSFSMAALLSVGLVLRALAQSGDSPWTTPVNVSQSGAASQPVIATAPNGMLYALWWDSLEGELYARTTSVTGTIWTAPTSVEQIVGKRQIDPQTQKVTITAPRDVYMLSDARGNVHVFWFDSDNQLLNAQTQGAAWSSATLLAEAALVMDAQADAVGGLHLIYVRPLSSPGAPAGLYYRTTAGGMGWSAPVLVYASSYFRTAKPEETLVSVASDGQGLVLVTWDDPHLTQSFYARSADGGRTWTEPLAVNSGPTGQATKARMASTGEEFLLIWQDTTAGGCGLTQHRSTDGGQTWSAPERVLTTLSRCPERWSLASEGKTSTSERGRLWLIGTSPQGRQNDSSGSGIMAAWDGATWSKPVDVSLSFRDSTTGKTQSLACLRITLTEQNVGLVGCDADGDVWAARNAVGLDNLIPALKPVWSTLEILSDRTGQAGSVTLAADDSKLYAMWSQSAAESGPGAALYIAIWESNRWSRATRVIRPMGNSTGVTTSDQSASKAEQPALVADHQSRLHAVWSGGTSGQILYSRAYARDAASAQGWAEPVALPAPSLVGSWPDILADPRGDVLHVIYAVPFNEGRGIYYVRSDDGGRTWLAPTAVFDAAEAGWNSADKPRMALDANTNVLHAVWLRSTLPGGTSPQMVTYARSTDGGHTWSAPIKVAEGAVDWPRVVVASGTGRVYLIWNQARGLSGSVSSSIEVWSQSSPDGGQRWTEAARVRGFEDISGPVSVASDGAGGLYLVGVGRTTSGESALLYSRWDGTTWSERQTFGLGQDATLGNAVVAALMPSAKWLSVVLRELVMNQAGTKQFEIVATGREVTTASAAAPAPTFTPLPTSTSAPTATPRPTATARPQLATTAMPQPAGQGPFQGQWPLVMGGVLAVVIVLGVVIARVIWVARQ